MKKHILNIWFDLPNGGHYHFIGLVQGIHICEKKLFKNAFGFDMPPNTQITVI